MVGTECGEDTGSGTLETSRAFLSKLGPNPSWAGTRETGYFDAGPVVKVCVSATLSTPSSLL